MRRIKSPATRKKGRERERERRERERVPRSPSLPPAPATAWFRRADRRRMRRRRRRRRRKKAARSSSCGRSSDSYTFVAMVRSLRLSFGRPASSVRFGSVGRSSLHDIPPGPGREKRKSRREETRGRGWTHAAMTNSTPAPNVCETALLIASSLPDTHDHHHS